MMKITIAADPGGVELKNVVKKHLLDLGHEVCDKGGEKDAPVLYPVVGDLVAKDVQSGAADRGIVFCGTGMGVSIVANKHKGVYCAANMLALGGGLVGTTLGLKIVDTFLNTEWKADADEARAKRLEGFFAAIRTVEDEQFR